MEIKKSDYRILLALESNPMMSISQLSNVLSISWPTVKKRLKELEENKILYNPLGDYNINSLGLEKYYIICNAKTIEYLKKIELACKEHPYTLHRSRYISHTNGLFLQFNIPQNTSNLLSEFFIKLQEIGFVEEFELFKSRGTRLYLNAQLTEYNIETGIWDFSWYDWVKNISKSTTAYEEEKDQNLMNELKPIHLNILREITRNASIKQSKLMKLFNLSRTDSHRHHKFVFNNLISRVRVYYDFSKVNFNDTNLVLIPNLDSEEISKLINCFHNFPPPFPMTIDVMDDNTILIWGVMDNTQAIDFVYAFWEKYSSMEHFFLNSRHNGSELYWFYPNNFDFKTHDWIKSRDYMVTSPIDRLANSN